MKKFIAALLVMSMVLALATTAFAYKDTTADKFVLFKGSSYGYKKVYNNHGAKFSGVVLRKGSIAHVVAEKGDWYKIEIPKTNGKGYERFYFAKKFTMKTPAVEECLIYSTAGNRRGGGDYKEDFTVDEIKGTKIKTSGHTELYKEGSLKSKMLTKLKKGKTVVLTGKVAVDVRRNTYFQAKYGKKTGYVPASRLDRTEVWRIMTKVGADLAGE